MILLITPSVRNRDCASALNEATGMEVRLAENLLEAVGLLRVESFLLVVLDQQLLEIEPLETDTVMEHLGAAMPLQINFAISSMQRLIREVNAALRRRKSEEAAARQLVIRAFESQLNETITALLLSCELTLNTPGIPSEARQRIASGYELVKRLREELHPVSAP